MATHMEVVHNWAKQSGKDKKGFNMYSRGNIIFSYGEHFPIARIMEVSRIVLMTSEGYSVSTAKHKSYTWRGIHKAGLKAFVVPFVLAGNSHSDESNRQEHMANALSYKGRIQEAYNKAKRARTYKDMHLETAERLQKEMEEYCEAFDVVLEE